MFSLTSIASIPDVRVVRVNNFLAVVATDEWAALRAAETLKVTRSEGQRLPGHERLAAVVRDGAIDRDQPFVSKGDAPAAITKAARTFPRVTSGPIRVTPRSRRPVRWPM